MLLVEREAAIEGRARELADKAIAQNAGWIQLLGNVTTIPAQREAWLANMATIAAYRERWHIQGDTVIGKESNVGSIEQLCHWERAHFAAKVVIRLSADSATRERLDDTTPAHQDLTVATKQGVER